jgi:hypothetical protein
MRLVPSADNRCFSGHCLCLKYSVLIIFCGFENDAVGMQIRSADDVMNWKRLAKEWS